MILSMSVTQSARHLPDSGVAYRPEAARCLCETARYVRKTLWKIGAIGTCAARRSCCCRGCGPHHRRNLRFFPRGGAVTIVGHSWGAMLALCYTAEHPGKAGPIERGGNYGALAP